MKFLLSCLCNVLSLFSSDSAACTGQPRLFLRGSLRPAPNPSPSLSQHKAHENNCTATCGRPPDFPLPRSLLLACSSPGVARPAQRCYFRHCVLKALVSARELLAASENPSPHPCKLKPQFARQARVHKDAARGCEPPAASAGARPRRANVIAGGPQARGGCAVPVLATFWHCSANYVKSVQAPGSMHAVRVSVADKGVWCMQQLGIPRSCLPDQPTAGCARCPC